MPEFSNYVESLDPAASTTGTILIPVSHDGDPESMTPTQIVSAGGGGLGFTPENVANKSTSTSLGASDTLYPSQNAVKTYVDNKLAYDTIEVVLGALAGETIAKQIPANCTILSSTICSDVSGSMVVDIWKDTRANFPPTVADTITASAKPTLSSATLSYNNTLTGWTTSLAKGDWLIFKVDSASTLLKATVSLEILRT